MRTLATPTRIRAIAWVANTGRIAGAAPRRSNPRAFTHGGAPAWGFYDECADGDNKIGKEGLPLVEKLIDVGSYSVAYVLDLLLCDKSTKKNIIWATDTYEEYGEGFTDKTQMNGGALLGRAGIIRPRIQKSLEAQAERPTLSPATTCQREN